MAHYFENDENLKHDLKEININLLNQHFTFLTDAGVFSKKGLDFGTRTLLETLPFDQMKGDILDLGCGYGPIGIVTAKLTKQNVDMIDVNKRALELVNQNKIKNHVLVTTILSDGIGDNQKKYDYILTNPPIRVGKEKLYQLLFEAKKHLKINGEMWLVINKNQGALSLARDLQKEFQVTVENKKKGFYILCAKNLVKD